MIGHLLVNRYKIIHTIGESPYAVVYAAVDITTGDTVAVKLLDEHLVTETSFTHRFLKEAHAIARLSHPNIIQIIDYSSVRFSDETGGSSFYVAMPLIAGKTLRTLIDEQQPVPIHETLRIMLQILQGLAVAHARRIVHRGLHPDNVLLTQEGNALVTDFGLIATLRSHLPIDQGLTIKSAAYIAPEQAQRWLVTPATDVYSAAIILYEMLTGMLPFTGSTALEIAMKQVMQTPTPPREINPSIPSSLQTVILKALAKQPEQRYQHATQMFDDLLQVAMAADQATNSFPALPLVSAGEGELENISVDQTQIMPVIKQPNSGSLRS